jgi:hypothetical protein
MPIFRGREVHKSPNARHALHAKGDRQPRWLTRRAKPRRRAESPTKDFPPPCKSGTQPPVPAPAVLGKYGHNPGRCAGNWPTTGASSLSPRPFRNELALSEKRFQLPNCV